MTSSWLVVVAMGMTNVALTNTPPVGGLQDPKCRARTNMLQPGEYVVVNNIFARLELIQYALLPLEMRVHLGNERRCFTQRDWLREDALTRGTWPTQGAFDQSGVIRKAPLCPLRRTGLGGLFSSVTGVHCPAGAE